jgi:DNA polymerase-3 subunit gamma/tau
MAPKEDAFVATARKYRPQTFAEILAQPGVTVTLKNALATGRVHHAYLFSGPRGTGKTTTARVLAKALNCTNATAGDPCGTCDACVNFQSGQSMDVIEIDGASNRGVDDIRSLRERVAYASVGGGYKVYIVDEVHMLTNEAFNALLKTLEEPPKKVAFIFATTEPGKVPATILSRCQRFDFRRIAPEPIAKAVRKVASVDSLEIDDGAVELLARRAQGSLRDAFSLLDQTVAFAEGAITRPVVEEALGVISEESLFNMTALWSERRTTEAFALLNDLWEAGIDPGEWATAYGDHLRDLLAAHVGGVASPGPRFEEAAKVFELGDLLRAQIMLSELKIRLRHLNDPRPDVELYILRVFTLADTVSLSQAMSGNAPVASRPGKPPATKSKVIPENPAPVHDPPNDPTLELKVSARPRDPDPEPEPEPQATTTTEDESLPVEPWERFLVVLRKKAPWAASELRQGKLESHADGLAKFFIPESNPFNRDRFSSKGIRTAVEEAFKSVYGEKPRVEFRFGDSVKRSGDAQSLMGDNPALAELIQATDGEIVARRPRRREE